MFQANLLKTKRILITGGGTGLGRAMAERFLHLGAAVYICGRRADVLQQTCQELAGQTAGEIRSFVCDVRDRDAVEQMIANIWDAGPLNVLVNNAAGNFIARTEELSPRAWEAVLGIVLQGTMNLTWLAGGVGKRGSRYARSVCSPGGVDFESTRHVRSPSRGKAACPASRRPLQRVRCFVSAVDVGAGRTSYRAIIPASIWSSRWQ